jgi:hypothetical protein
MTTTRQVLHTVPPRGSRDSGADLATLGQGVYIACAKQDVDALVDMFTHWFANRDDITLVDAGSSQKGGQGFVILEWEGEVERRMLTWLRNQETVDDYSLYTAFHGQEEDA